METIEIKIKIPKISWSILKEHIKQCIRNKISIRHKHNTKLIWEYIHKQDTELSKMFVVGELSYLEYIKLKGLITACSEIIPKLK